MGSRSNKSELPLILSSARLRLVYYFVQMLLREDLTFQRLTGFSNLTLQMILMIIFIELEELEEARKVAAKPCSF